MLLPASVRLSEQVASPPLEPMHDDQDVDTEAFLLHFLEFHHDKSQHIELVPFRQAAEGLRSRSQADIGLLKKVGKFLYKWERSKRATLPLSLPL